jgi:hypothetical protein
MFKHSYRGTIAWLLIIGFVLGLTLTAGDVPSSISAIMLASYLALVLLVTRGAWIGSIIDALPTSATREMQISEVAREAATRARHHPDYDALIRLMDVGLIVDERRPDGLALRRGRFISLDDDGIRPFAIITVPDGLSERVALIRFEIRDESGQVKYAFEDDKWLQAGANTILPGYRLPVRESKSDLEAGTWTVHLSIDGGLVGLHNFNLSPSLVRRRSDMLPDGEIRERVWRSEDEEDAALPLSLEELLRQQSQQRRQT